MASSQQPVSGSAPTAQVVGNAFVHQYYLILHHSPELVYRFYQDSSKMGRSEPDGTLSSITTMHAINEKILSIDYREFRAEIRTVDAQESFNGGVLVLVTGYLTGKDNVKRNFTQSFFLAPQDKGGYFVLNDIFRYMDDVEHHDGNHSLDNGVVAPPTPDQEPVTSQEHLVYDQTTPLSEEDVNVEEVYNPSDNEEGSVVEEETPVDEVVKEIQNDSQMVVDSNSNAHEEMPKKSYASIVKVMKESATSLSVPTPARPEPASQERQVAPPSPPASVAETPVSISIAIESGSTQGEDGGHSIYIKNLPLNATSSQLEEEFKRFGPIKSGGVQVRSNKQQGFCFGFVEFEVASAVQSAIEASPITIGSRQAYVEEKRASSSRANNNNRGRFTQGRVSGFRNDGARGRGNYGSGRAYVRGDFNNRTEFVNRGGGGGGRGGSSGRANDGIYQRVDHTGSSGGRMNRSSALADNPTAKTVAPRVPAPA